MEVYRSPADTFVAGFPREPADEPARGADRRWRGGRSGRDLRRRPARAAFRRGGQRARRLPDRAVILGIRPEDLREERAVAAMQPVDLQVVAVEALGPEVILIGSLPGPARPSWPRAWAPTSPPGSARRSACGSIRGGSPVRCRDRQGDPPPACRAPGTADPIMRCALSADHGPDRRHDPLRAIVGCPGL